MEKTLLIVKPDAMPKASQLLAKVLWTTELTLVEARRVRFNHGRVEALYGHVKHVMGERFFEMGAFLQSCDVLAVVLEGEGAVAKLRAALGPTDPRKGAPDSIRRLWGDTSEGAPIYRNAAHASDSPGRADFEINLFLE